MWNKAGPLTGAALLILAACQPAIAGGPCRYESSEVEASVIEVDADQATFNGPDGEFYVSSEYLGTLPAAGDTLILKRERIIEGTCTPEIYTVLERPE